MPRYASLSLIFAFAATLIASPVQVRASETIVLVQPRIYNFPGQQLCQVDRNDRRYREFCAPQSYHAFGASGYRPFGTYERYRIRDVERDWPSARVIQVNPNR
jgi:hypothetical protein